MWWLNLWSWKRSWKVTEFEELKRVRTLNCFQHKGYHVQWDEVKADNLLFCFAEHPWSRNITLAIFTSQEVGKGRIFFFINFAILVATI